MASSYDYVLQFGLDRLSQAYVQNIRNRIRQNDLVDRQRGWLPHITIDKYKCKEEDKIVEIIDSVVEGIYEIPFAVEEFGNFDGETLYLKPSNIEEFQIVKETFDKALKNYKVKGRDTYNPHITLCTNDKLEESIDVVMSIFSSFSGYACKLWLYDEKMCLIKEWLLKL